MTGQDFPEFNNMTDTRHGRMLYNKNDVYIGRSLEQYGEFSPGETELFQSFLKPGMFAIEAGANIGSHTLPMAQMVGPKGIIYAFEPQRIVFQTLCANTALNNLNNVVTYHAAVGEEAGMITVPDLNPTQTCNFGGLSLEGCETGIRVPLISIDSMRLKNCHFIKADVEGMEESVLRGGDETIKRCLPILYIENDRADKSESLIQYVSSLGYRMFVHTPPLYSPNNYKNNPQNVFPNLVSENLLCIHRSLNPNISGFQEITAP